MHEDLSQGLQAIITPHVADTTLSLSSLQESQSLLAAELERLANRLQQYSEESKVTDLKPVLAKTQEMTKRLTHVSDVLRAVEVRLLAVKKEVLIRNMKQMRKGNPT